MTPTVSIILPTYNRARFLPQAFASICAQTFTDWELIIVDDGSSDNSREIVDQLASPLPQNVKYVYQTNQGPAVARNTGIENATGELLAFFDSDDEWVSDHLAKCVDAFSKNSDVDWIFAASRRIDFSTRKVLTEHSFRESPPPRFLSLSTRKAGDLHIIDDPHVRCCVLRGSGFGGMQCSVVRRSIFATLRFEANMYMFEDRIILMRAAVQRVRFAYFDTVSTIVYTHDANVSFANPDAVRNRIASYRIFIDALERLRTELPKTPAEFKAFDARLANECFWNLAYPLAQSGEIQQALPLMRRALELCPFDLRMRKSYLATLVKAKLRRRPVEI